MPRHRPRPPRIGTADIVVGAIAGTAATVTMTLAADALYRRLPRHERYPLPPRELTERALGRRHVSAGPGEGRRVAATLLAHFAFGAAAGALFPLLPATIARRPLCGGIGYGLLVWTVSYLGWIPAFGLLRSAVSHPARRNLLMILVHVVWGGTLGTAHRGLSRALMPFRGGSLGDR